MKKYIVLPYDIFNRLKSNFQDKEDKEITANKNLDEVMYNNTDKIMHNNEKNASQNFDNILTKAKNNLNHKYSNDISDSHKMALYQQALQKAIIESEILNKPLEFELKGSSLRDNNISQNENSPQEENIDNSDEIISTITTILPKTYVPRAMALYNYLKNLDSFTWDNEGKIYIEGTLIKSCNIIDLIYILSRNKVNIHLNNWELIKSHFQKVNIPISLIYNENKVKDILTSPVLKVTPQSSVHKVTPYPLRPLREDRLRNPREKSSVKLREGPLKTPQLKRKSSPHLDARKKPTWKKP